MKHQPIISAIGSLAMCGVASATSIFPGTPYIVDGDGFAHGCFDPCDCPLAFTPDLSGSFSLVPRFIIPLVDKGGPDDPIIALPFDVNDVELIVGNPRGVHQLWTGSGTYVQYNTPKHEHQMQLDLTNDGQTFLHFDSGVVPNETALPQINIAISLNGMVCVDSVYYINAAPPEPLVGDLNGDDVVDGLDLGILLSQWTAAGGPLCGLTFCPADLNLDGVVDGLDLGILLANWTL